MVGLRVIPGIAGTPPLLRWTNDGSHDIDILSVEITPKQTRRGFHIAALRFIETWQVKIHCILEFQDQFLLSGMARLFSNELKGLEVFHIHTIQFADEDIDGCGIRT